MANTGAVRATTNAEARVKVRIGLRSSTVSDAILPSMVVVAPDLAGWRRERMPEMPVDKAWFELAPDWVCEVLSPSTAGFDRGDKRKAYHAHGVSNLWFVDPEAKTLEILVHEPKGYRVLDVHSGDVTIRAVPFDAIELSLGVLWLR